MTEDIVELISVVREAGKIVMAYRRDGFSVGTKADALDYVTDADRESDRFLSAAIRERFPGDAILTEETELRPTDYHGRVWMIDPLDGTRHFVEGSDGFSVMIGLAIDGRPEIGIVHDPVLDATYFAKRGEGAFRKNGDGPAQRLFVSRTGQVEGMTLVERTSKGEDRPIDRLVETLGIGKRISGASTGLKIAYVAEGIADAVFNSNPRAMKWDFCAAQVILEEAGGCITGFDGAPLDYLVPDERFSALTLASNGILHEDLLARLRDFALIRTDTHIL
ncbi:MAG: 3'(2'),5'-bisphosphate nucleotidase CysQ [Candidatus Moranbacteria bacterium]|nr:3'(2'),5'-bisphosphate nucleotidase CysQ [Candidatus Moranbacteria bacterium]